MTNSDAAEIRGHAAGAYAGIRVLVLGASGFIGSRLTAALTVSGAEVIAVVRDKKAFARITLRPMPNIAVCDVTRLADVTDLVKDARPAVTFNLAGYGVDRSERGEELAGIINGRIPEVLADCIAALQHPPWSGQALVHVGSALEYGEAAGDLREDTRPRPTTVYGRSKLAGTTGVAERCRVSGLAALTARLFTVYGPGEHAGRLLPTLIEAARSRRPVELTSGTQLRDFTFVDDAVAGLLRLGVVHGADCGEIVNLATGRLTSVRDFTERAAAVLNLDRGLLRFGSVPTRTEEMAHLPVSIGRLRELTGWTPEMDIEEGVLRTAREYSSALKDQA